MNIVTNKYDIEIEYDVAVQLMDDDLREYLHGELAPCSCQELFKMYAIVHKAVYGKVWELDQPNPTY